MARSAAPMASMIARSLTKTEPRQSGRPRHDGRARASAIRARDQAVPQAAHGLDEGGMARVVPELLAQPAHEDVDRAIVGLPVHAARLVEDAVAGEDAPR